MKLKICGLSRPNEVETCINNGVDFCGFILNFPKSHRYINNELANKLTNLDKKKSRFVGVLVQPSKKELEKFSKLNLDYFQLYGNYNDDQIFQIIYLDHQWVFLKFPVQNFLQIYHPT